MKNFARRNGFAAGVSAKAIESAEEIAFLYDTRYYNGSSEKTSFFRQDPTRNVLYDNYRAQPLEDQRRGLLTSLVIDPTLPLIVGDDAKKVYPAEILNLILGSSLIIENSGGRYKQLDVPLEHVFNVEGMDIVTKPQTVTDGGGAATATQYAIFSGTNEVPIVQPFFLTPGFDMYIKWGPGYAELSDADFSGQAADFGFKVGMQLVYFEKRKA